MPQFQTIQAVLNGGEMSPLMDGRTDSPKYATGCRALENFIVRPQGAVFKRPGTEFLGITRSSGDKPTIIIPFRRSTSVNFILAIDTDGISIRQGGTGARVTPTILDWDPATQYKVGDYVRHFQLPVGNSLYYVTVAHLSGVFADDLAAGYFVDITGQGYYMPLPSVDLTDIRDIQYKQVNDQVFLARGNMMPKRISRLPTGYWAIEDVPFQFAPTIDPEENGVTMTLVYDAPDWISFTTYAVGDYVLYLNELYRAKTANGDFTFTPAKWDKAVYLPSWNIAQAYIAGNVVEFFGSNYFCILAHTSSNANRPAPGAGLGTQWVLLPFLDYRLIASASTFSAGEVGTTWLLQPGSKDRYASEKVGAGLGVITGATVFIQGDYLFRTTWNAGSATDDTTYQLQESRDRINFTTIREWRISTVNEGTIAYSGTAPQTGAWYRSVANRTGPGTNGTGSMIIEPATAQLDIPFLIQELVSTTQVKGVPLLAVDSLLPNEVLGFAFPIWRRGAFNDLRGYPQAVAFHDSRLWFAGTSTEPARLWGSQIDDFYTFQTGALDTSGIDVSLAATETNDIQWMESYNRTMVIGTTGEEWTLDSGDADNALTPSSIRLRRRSRYGSLGPQPILAADALLWIDRGNRLREFAYRFESDSYVGPDMSLLADHLIAQVPLQCSFGKTPDPTVWMVTAKGRLLGFSYDREQNITGWHRHNTGPNGDDEFISLCSLYSEFGVDELYFVVKRVSPDYPDGKYQFEKFDARSIAWIANQGDGVLQNFGETLEPRHACTYMDARFSPVSSIYLPDDDVTQFTIAAAISNFKDNTSMMLGSEETENEGVPIERPVDSIGVIQFPGDLTGKRWWIGLPYTAIVVPNRMEVQLQTGTAQLNVWRSARVAFRLWRSIYGQVCQNIAQIESTLRTRIDTSDISPFPQTPGGTSSPTVILDLPWGQTRSVTITADWQHALDLTMSSRHPVPFNIIAILIDVEVGADSAAKGGNGGT